MSFHCGGLLLLIFCQILIGQNALLSAEKFSHIPVVMWHGMGDTCCFPFSLGSVKRLIKENTDDTYVKSIEIGGNILSDYKSGFFIHPSKQIKDACKQIKGDPNLAGGYNAIGFSQGSQFLRAIAQKCPEPPMRNLITLGGQHQGIFGLPACPSLSSKSCEYIRKLLNHAAYESWVQKELVQATFWHDPLHEEEYKNKSTFLSDLNNELTTQNDYAVNLQKLEKFVMVKFANDTIVQPKETQWFEYYQPGQDSKIRPLTQSDIYLQDRLGLRQMDLEGKLIFLEAEGDHLKFTAEWFIQNIIPYLL